MHISAARMIVCAFAVALMSGCSTFAVAKAPSFRERDLRPMNQDLAAWLERLNAKPADNAAPVMARQAPTAPALKQSEQLAAEATATVPSPDNPSSTPVPSPTAVSALKATAPTPSPAPAVAVAAGASSSLASPSVAPVKPADSLTPDGQQAPAPPILHAAAGSPSTASALEPPAAQGSVVVATGGAKSALIAAPPKPQWKAENGSSLRNVVEGWAKTANWVVVWDAEIDYPIVGTLSYDGELIDAIRGIFLAHAKAERPLKADVYIRQQLIHITE